MNSFEALVVDKVDDDVRVGIKEMTLSDLPEGDVTIRVAWSSVNYKDGLASIPNGNIVKSWPFVPGIDLAGTVVSSSDDRFHEGDEVIVTSYELGVSHYGGFSQYARVPADWVVPLPNGLSLKEAMLFGTAGFTAALSIQRLEDNGLTPSSGPVIVTGATGGVGSIAVSILAKLGYHVVASTGKANEHDYLKNLGVKEILTREDVSPEKIRSLDKQRFAGAIDPVGGRTLSWLLSTTKYGGSVAVCGLTGGTNVATTVFPFILRGINLLGIDSVYCPMHVRKNLWERIATDFKLQQSILEVGSEVTLQELPAVLSSILKGQTRGRVIVKLA